MKKLLISVLVLILIITACNHSAEVSKKDPLESGRGFIESSLKGDYDEAQKYILQDSTNMEYFNGMKDFNSKRNDDEKEGYKNANILIDSTQQLSDSVTVITYSNTFKNKPSRLKMIKKNNEWLVDFKYTFNGNGNM
jgi:type IV secretory pathway component VirB8